MSDELTITPTSGPSDRARRLFRFLRDLSQLRSKSERDVAQYENVVWFAERPEEYGWSRFEAEEDETHERDTWLEMERVRLPKPPSPSDLLARWIRLSHLNRSDLEEPGLLDPYELEVEIPDL